MKVSHILDMSIITESMIKLPAKLLSKLQVEFRTLCLSYMRARLHKAAKAYVDQYSAEGIKLALKEFDAFFKKKYPNLKATKYNLDQRVTWREIGDFDNDDLDPRYRKLMDMGGVEYEWPIDSAKPLKLAMDLRPKGDAAGGAYEADENAIEINMAPIRQWSWDLYFKAAEKKSAKNYIEILERLADKIDRIEGVLEHELGHYMQFKVLARGSEKQVSDEGYAMLSEPEEEQDKQVYYTSQVEFGPHIMSVSKDLTVTHRALERKLKRKVDWKVLASLAIGEIDKAEVFKKLKIEGEAYVGEHAEFFRNLKRLHPTQWKKAVKVLMTRLEKDLN